MSGVSLRSARQHVSGCRFQFGRSDVFHHSGVTDAENLQKKHFHFESVNSNLCNGVAGPKAVR